MEDCRKKLLTDITTKALSFLGFNADVFLGQHDDNKYLSQVSEETKNKGVTLGIGDLRKLKPVIAGYLEQGETGQQILDKIEKNFQSVMPKARDIIKSLTSENIETKIK